MAVVVVSEVDRIEIWGADAAGGTLRSQVIIGGLSCPVFQDFSCG